MMNEHSFVTIRCCTLTQQTTKIVLKSRTVPQT